MPDNYGTIGGFRAYHDDRGNPNLTIDDEDVQSSLLVGSEWLDAVYRSGFPGLKVGQRAQVREWPRVGGTDIYGYAIDASIVPVEIEKATYEAAMRQALTPGSLSKDWTPSKYKRVSVDGAVSVDYVSFANANDIQTRFAIIDQILAPILTGYGGTGTASALTGCATRV